MSERDAAAGLDVLLVGDGAAERSILGETLRSRGHRVAVCDNADTWWDAYLSSSPDLVVVDLALPVTHATEFCRRVRRNEGTEGPVIVVVTGSGEPRVLDELLAAGADDYLVKPIDTALMKIRLAVAEGRVVRQQAGQRTADELNSGSPEFSALIRIGELTLARRRRDDAMDEVLDEMSRITGYPMVMVERFDPTRETLQIVHARGFDVPPQAVAMPLGQALSGPAVRDLKPHADTRTRRHEGRLDPRLVDLGDTTCVSFPMILGGVPVGALTLIHFERVDVSPRLLRLGAGFANTLAAYLQRLEAEAALHGSEARLRSLEQQLQQANRELESFAHSLSHDLRSPLRTMEGFAYTLLQEHSGTLTPEARRYVRRIVASGRRAERLIADLLQYSGLSFEKISLERVSLERVVGDALKQLEADLASAGAEVRVEAGLPEVRGHLTILIRVVVNLVSNAAKFVPDGRAPVIRIRGRMEEGRVRLEVEDNGIGVPEEKRERIFGVFERLASHTPSPEGTGIGLAIVRRGIERLGGQVGVEAAPDGGSVFWFELPS